MTRPLVYIAGPIGKADEGRLKRVHDGMIWGKNILEWGGVPVIPHLLHFFDQVFPTRRSTLMLWDLAILERCDALFRMNGPSPGADEEARFAASLRLRIFHENADDLVLLKDWLRRANS